MNEAQQNVFVVEVDMENRAAEDIAREAALKIVGITDALMEQLARNDFIDEEHGVLTIEDITRKCAKVLEQYGVNFCYLFGSYAKGKEMPESDVDLLISANVRGLRFYELVEELRVALCKKVDVLDINQLRNNIELTEEILRDGIKIYG